MNTAVCLAGYGLAVAVVVPGWLARVAGPSALTRGMRLCVVESVWRVRMGQLGLALTVLVLGAGPYLWAALPVCSLPMA